MDAWLSSTSIGGVNTCTDSGNAVPGGAHFDEKKPSGGSETKIDEGEMQTSTDNERAHYCLRHERTPVLVYADINGRFCQNIGWLCACRQPRLADERDILSRQRLLQRCQRRGEYPAEWNSVKHGGLSYRAGYNVPDWQQGSLDRPRSFHRQTS